MMQTPEINWRRMAASHPDHRAAGEATLAAVYPDARNPFAHPELLRDEGLDAWTVREIWLSPSGQAGRYIDVTDTFDRKIAALRAHVSQTAHMDEPGNDGARLADRQWTGRPLPRGSSGRGVLRLRHAVISRSARFVCHARQKPTHAPE